MGYSELSLVWVSVGPELTNRLQAQEVQRALHHMTIMRSQGDIDSVGVSDISQPLSKWQCIYLPIGENW